MGTTVILTVPSMVVLVFKGTLVHELQISGIQ